MKNQTLRFALAGGSICLSIGIVAAFMLAIVPLYASAETVVRTGGDVSINAGQVVENDFYAAGGGVVHSGEVQGDMYVAAGSVTVNGEVGEDLTVLGGTINVHNTIGDDLRVVGGEAVIAGEVKDDVFVLGGKLHILSTAKIGGNVYFYGGEAVIDGEVLGTVMGHAERFTINSAVSGVDVVGVLELQDNASVKGDVRYQSEKEITRSQSAAVSGQIVRGDAADAESSKKSNFGLFALLAWFFTTLCLFFLFRGKLEQLWRRLRREPAKSGIFGLVAIIAGPILTFILFVTVLGAWLGLLTLIALTALILVGMLLLPIMLGRLTVSIFPQWDKMNFGTVLVGFIGTALLCSLPWFGGLLIFAALVITMGGLLLVVYRGIKDQF
ncbi:hypothetical protein A2837_00990 [Candidatus Kaiserbacteria bacterium RIFCSPHIGHO2_01_FULL_46_22]|uniref:DUF8173 domain-containing protein n=1 Tax=Candidatus Kaiserbacteria bacterium RIFCSPHIGHO2_01_FULL_46_22 TaxID=1798475 RepID=A0A1F6BXU8_9BACT|nr:MAG: hypothetical protein A2837_00990 [Candidatus Kaiserbacteria bacterium RIFCSPHIGHO2_01_FULL_46_22]